MDVRDYCKRLEKIQKKELLSRLELAKHTGISYGCLKHLTDPESERMPSLKTLRKLRDFVHGYEENRIKI